MTKILNVYIRSLTLSDAVELLNLEKKNQAFFQNHSITRPENYWTLETHKELIGKWEEHTKKDIEYQFGIFQINNDVLIGTIIISCCPWTLSKCNFRIFLRPRT